MRYIFVDFEMCPVPMEKKSIRRKCAGEIIEIGAVMYDENMVCLDEYRRYVKPRYSNRIQDHVVRITGITMDMLRNKPEFPEALEDFYLWCAKDSDYKLLAWSENDLLQLKNECKLRKADTEGRYKPIIDNWINYQKEFTRIIGLGKIVGLDKALAMTGLEFKGKQHDAVYDAKNTAMLFDYVRKLPEEEIIRIRDENCEFYGLKKTPEEEARAAEAREKKKAMRARYRKDKSKSKAAAKPKKEGAAEKKQAASKPKKEGGAARKQAEVKPEKAATAGKRKAGSKPKGESAAGKKEE